MMQRTFIETKMTTHHDGTITGLAWPFNSGDRIGDWIEKGAFNNTALPLPMLFAHDQSDPVGAWTKATEDDVGLQLEGKLLIDQLIRAREVSALVHVGAVKGLSIGFKTLKSEPRSGGGRTIKELELLEVSLVSIPMHAGAKITSAKSMVQALQFTTEIERVSAHFRKEIK